MRGRGGGETYLHDEVWCRGSSWLGCASTAARGVMREGADSEAGGTGGEQRFVLLVRLTLKEWYV